MNNIYRKEQEVSSKENNVKSNARNTNSLECKGNITIKATAEYIFFKSTLHFHQKVSQKHTKNQNTKSGTRPTWHRVDEAANMRF